MSWHQLITCIELLPTRCRPAERSAIAAHDHDPRPRSDTFFDTCVKMTENGPEWPRYFMLRYHGAKWSTHLRDKEYVAMTEQEENVSAFMEKSQSWFHPSIASILTSGSVRNKHPTALVAENNSLSAQQACTKSDVAILLVQAVQPVIDSDSPMLKNSAVPQQIRSYYEHCQ